MRLLRLTVLSVFLYLLFLPFLFRYIAEVTGSFIKQVNAPKVLRMTSTALNESRHVKNNLQLLVRPRVTHLGIC